MNNNHYNIWIVDFGSQYTQLITRKSRELGYSSEIITLTEAKNRFHENQKPKCLILSGGPQSVFSDTEDYSIFFKDQGLPILGICYGMQILGKYFGGVVEKGIIGEYGPMTIQFSESIENIPTHQSVWMSHSDHVSKMPNDFSCWMKSDSGLTAGIKHTSRPIIGLQFHPEVDHSPHGKSILHYFFNNIAKLQSDWNSKSMLDFSLEEIKKVKVENILCAFSGGVDSLVAASLTALAYPQNLYCYYVDNGLQRPQDRSHLENLIKHLKLNIKIIDAKDRFLSELKNVSDPETKRKIIGKVFIEVFESEVNKSNIKFSHLLQGTLYPDVIESISPHLNGGKSVTIKSHHNVGGLPERMKLKLLEPLRTFFKDEVRLIGEQLGLKSEWILRHPFPGPGLGIRILGTINPDSIRMVSHSDQILYEELNSYRLYNSTWQAFTVFLPIKTVGVKGDGRAYESVIALRMVNSNDGMTASFSHVPFDFLESVSRRITNEVAGITRVVYDITSKPPGTIEWE